MCTHLDLWRLGRDEYCTLKFFFNGIDDSCTYGGSLDTQFSLSHSGIHSSYETFN